MYTGRLQTILRCFLTLVHKQCVCVCVSVGGATFILSSSLSNIADKRMGQYNTLHDY